MLASTIESNSRESVERPGSAANPETTAHQHTRVKRRNFGEHLTAAARAMN
ncbi:MAG: hypothetical protein M3453_03670 [Pseudomonadota bacterium]|nr:hypothetical protein [Pseudomonadota bacterium]